MHLALVDDQPTARVLDQPTAKCRVAAQRTVQLGVRVALRSLQCREPLSQLAQRRLTLRPVPLCLGWVADQQVPPPGLAVADHHLLDLDPGDDRRVASGPPQHLLDVRFAAP